MLKKFLAVLLSAAMIAGLVTVPALAAAPDGYHMTFTGQTEDVSNWISLSDGSLVSGGGSWVYGIGGREASDQSLKLTGSGYFMNKFTMKDNVVIEFDVMFPGAVSSASEYKQFKFTIKGALINNEILHKSGSYSQNRWDTKVVNNDHWNHFVYEFDCANGTYNIYINGTLYKEGAAHTIANGAETEFRFLSNGANDEYPIYLDDIKYYSGTYDPSNATASLISGNGITVDESQKTVAFSETEVADVHNKLTVSSGACIVGVMDGDTYLTKTEGLVEDGDAIVLCAADGITYSYYTVGIQKTASYSQNFNSVGIIESLTGWPNLAVGEYLCAGGTRAGIGGKASDDISALTGTKDSYFRRDVTLYGISTIEFNTLVTESNWGYIGVSTSNTNMGFFQGSNKLNNTSKTYETGKWYHLAYVIDAANQKYDLYMNGEKVVNQGAVANIKEGSTLVLRIYGNSRYYDDLKIYSGTYDPSNSAVSLSANGLSVNNDSKTVSAIEGTVAEFLAKLTASNGGTVAGVVDCETFLTRADTDAVQVGDRVAVLAADGVTYSYYDVVGRDCIVQTFVDDDFTGLTGTRVSDYNNGDGQAAAAGLTITRNGLGYNEETGEGAYYEIIADGDDEIMKMYSKNFNSHPFFGKNLAAGTTGKTVVEFSVKKPDKLTASKLIFYGPNESTKNESSNWNFTNAIPVAFETDGLIYFNDEALGAYNLDRWYRVIVVTDIPGNKMTIYINGIKCAEKVFEDPIVKIYDIRFQMQKSEKECITYYDDIKWYEIDSSVDFYDEEKIADLTSSSNSVVVKAGATGGIIATELATVADVLNLVTSHGTIKAYDAAGNEITDTQAALAHGVYLEVTSADGLATAKYTYVVDSVSPITFSVEGTETVDGTITATVHVVNSDETTPTAGELIIAVYEGKKLVSINSNAFNAACFYGGYTDADYSVSIDVTNSAIQSVKAFLWNAVSGVKPLADDAELTVSSTNF